jgi:hypothetical protein
MKKIFLVLILSLFSLQVFAFEKIEIQSNFNSLSKSYKEDLVTELGNVINFTQTQPAESLGLLGFNISANIKMIDIEETKDYWLSDSGATSAAGSLDEYIIVPQLTVSKGLISGLDVEASLMPVSGADITAAGAALKWSFVEGSSIKPAFAVRAAYSTLIDKTNFDLENYDIGLSVSKGFGPVTPYGVVSYNKTEMSGISGVEDISEDSYKYGVGVKAALGLININGSVFFSDITMYNFSFNLGF